MTTTTSYFLHAPVLEFDAGCDADFQLEFTRVQTTTLDGKTTTLTSLGPYDFTGWSNFAGSMLSSDGATSKVVSIVVDGPASQGTLRLRARGVQTADFHRAGVRSGTLTIRGRNPQLLQLKVKTLRWHLVPGFIDPLTPPVFDWTVLR